MKSIGHVYYYAIKKKYIKKYLTSSFPHKKFCLFFLYQLCLSHLHAAEYYAVLCRVAPGERRLRMKEKNAEENKESLKNQRDRDGEVYS